MATNETTESTPAGPWALTGAEVLESLGSDPGGLDASQAAQRLAGHGPNELAPRPTPPWWRRLLVHVDDVLIYILLAAAGLKAAMGEWVDFWVIMTVAAVNAVIGMAQEGRARRALDSITDMLSTEAQVARAGTWQRLPAADLVPGDVIRVRPGDKVPADVRLLESAGLRAEESALTGESVPAAKDPSPVEASSGVGDRSSMLFSGTIIAAGTGTGVVVATGGDTELGHIQQMVAEVPATRTPLTQALDRFGATVARVVVVMAVVMAVVGRVFHAFTAGEAISAAIGFAVAAVPEGLPALVTITLALGVQQMAQRRAITRRLPAVETLGSVTTICSDKTGTLTRNEMTVRVVRTAAHTFDVEGPGYDPSGSVLLDGRPAHPQDHADLAALVDVAAVCNDAVIRRGGSSGWELVGEPTEGALRALSLRAGADGQEWERLAEVPFDSQHKYMGVLARRASTSGRLVLVKGAPDRILARCSAQVGPEGTPEPLDRAFWETQMGLLGGRGLRVLALARRTATPGQESLDHDDLDDGLELAGLVGIVDPPRPEATEAIATCHRAGITVKMITGDHADTAVAIAREMGIVRDRVDAPVLTGGELEDMSDRELQDVVTDVDVYARTSPEHKIRIVRALQARAQVVAMTGDGVNDAPALTQADVGVAMGIKGTEATKEAADIVLADDNFATIERAVEEGRRIFANIRKSILFLLPANGAQALAILTAVVLGMSLPLEPVQVLWINMVTSITLSVVLAGEKAEPGMMSLPPRDSSAPLLDRTTVRRLALVAVVITAATLASYSWEVSRAVPLEVARTTAVTTLALCQLAYLFSCRFLTRSSLTPRVLRGNRLLWWSVALLLLLQAAFVYVPLLHTWFGSAPMEPREWGIAAVLALLVFLVAEGVKALDIRRARTVETRP